MIETDAVVIGAGPVGLFQVFELGLLEINTHVIDSLPAVGGQCVELYPDKPIYDIPAIKATTGRELVAGLMAQIAPFKAQFHLGQEVTRLQKQADGRFAIETSRGLRLLAKTVHIAAGVGAFQPRRLKLDGIEAFVERQLFYRLPDAAQLAGKQVLIVGADDMALAAALSLVGAAAVTLMHRRDAFTAAPDTVARVHAACASGAMRFVVGQAIGVDQADGRLTGLQIVGVDGQASQLAADALLVFLGLSPKLGPVADWGLALQRKQLVVDTERFETSVPGIFAVGDINTYPGKRKLIVSGFHEATLAAFAAAQHVHPDTPVQLQYTTTSPRLHQLLGVSPPVSDR